VIHRSSSVCQVGQLRRGLLVQVVDRLNKSHRAGLNRQPADYECYCHLSVLSICKTLQYNKLIFESSTMSYCQRGENMSGLKIAQIDGCHICTSHCLDRDGYPIVTVDHKTKRLHRVIFESVYGPIPENRIVRHTCDSPSCVNPKHLILGTQAENIKDMVERGRGPSGERNGKAKLADFEVRKIRTTDRDVLNTVLAERYGVKPNTIARIKRGITWKHLTT